MGYTIFAWKSAEISSSGFPETKWRVNKKANEEEANKSKKQEYQLLN